MQTEALVIARWGWHVFPLHWPTPRGCSCGNVDCDDIGKHPRTAHGVKDATTEERTFRQWWGKSPEANIGIATGKASGLFVIDIDGECTLPPALQNLPRTITSKTSRGRHLYFRLPDGVKIGNRVKIYGLPIDVRGEGGYVVAPPSLHKNGNRYEWEVEPWDCELADGSPELLAWLTAPKKKRSEPSRNGKTTDWMKRARAYFTKIPPAIQGQNGSAQLMTALRLIYDRFDLDADQFRQIAEEYSDTCNPPWSEREIDHAIDNISKDPSKELWLTNGHHRHESNGPEPADTPTIWLGPDEHRVIEEVTATVARSDTDLFQRGGQLVRVTRPVRPPSDKHRVRHSGGPRIEPLPLPDLRARITRFCRLMQQRGEKECESPPPQWLPAGIGAQATPWRGIRPLESVSETPLLRPDGTILQVPGYDIATGILFEPAIQFEPIPAHVSRDDAIRAGDELLDVVRDFPFAAEMHKSAWLTSVLTPLARPAFEGPAPLFLTDANIRGCGKGLSASAAAIIATGRPFATAIYSHDPTEMQKTITAIALSGEPLIMLDNIAGPFGNASLDAALTSTEWQGRILGKSEQPRLPLSCCWYGTGNNCIIAADTARRTCHIRIESRDERPEEREGFKHPDLLAWVRTERPRLLRAALLILAAYCRAGRPQAPLKPWGSFEGWSALIRQAIVWIDMPDPANTRVALAENCDTDVDTLRVLMAVWRALVPSGESATAATVLNGIKSAATQYQAQYDALMSVLPDKSGGLPTPNRLGHALKKYRERVCDGQSFRAATDTHTKTAAWRLVGTEGA